MINKYLVHKGMQVDVVDAERLSIENSGTIAFVIDNKYYKLFAHGEWDKVTLCKQPESGNLIPNPLERDMSIKKSILKDG
jgi:hypothetical protein